MTSRRCAFNTLILAGAARRSHSLCNLAAEALADQAAVQRTPLERTNRMSRPMAGGGRPR